MALEITGPPRSFLFCLRLPALILAFGLGWAKARRRWGAAGGGPPVPMATPCLVLSSMLGTAAVAAKLTSVSPALAAAVLLTAAACCCLAGLVLTGGHWLNSEKEVRRLRPASETPGGAGVA